MEMTNIMDLLSTYLNVTIFVLSFCVGYAIKNAPCCKKVDNISIPLVILPFAIIIGLLDCYLTGTAVTVQFLATCAFSGLFSTAFYELYKSAVYYVQRFLLNRMEKYNDNTPIDDAMEVVGEMPETTDCENTIPAETDEEEK